MNGLAIQMDLFKSNESLEGQIFELYEKTYNREFKSHVQFIKASSLNEAEDMAYEVDPEYWRTKSVRVVSVDYAWKMFEQLHFSFRMCSSILGLEDTMFGEEE
tara:strand:+ start:420 stop:728 length:309 start_codon:yes stop_codon:yes gene_type:complete